MVSTFFLPVGSQCKIFETLQLLARCFIQGNSSVAYVFCSTIPTAVVHSTVAVTTKTVVLKLSVFDQLKVCEDRGKAVM